MTPVRVAPSLNPVKYLQPCFRLGIPFASCDELSLQRGKKTLSHGVVIRIAYRAHGQAHVHLLAPIAKCNAGVLAALVGVVNYPQQRVRWAQACPESPLQPLTS